MKYVTVTLNPAIDQTYSLSSPFETGKLNRAKRMSSIEYSGKGINVSLELMRNGRDSKVICLIGKEGGDEMYSSFLKENINLFAVRTSGRVRRNVSAVDPDGRYVEINEPGSEVELEEVLKFFAMYDRLVSERDTKIVMICGSAPPGFRNDVYKRLVISAKKAGKKVILDADGELLVKGLEGFPDMIKPNEQELSALTGCSLEGDEEQVRLSALAASSVVYEKSGVEVLCTLGEKGSVFAGKEGKFICPARKAQIKRVKGAGDVYLANFVHEHYDKESGVFDAMKKASEKTAEYLEK